MLTNAKVHADAEDEAVAVCKGCESATLAIQSRRERVKQGDAQTDEGVVGVELRHERVAEVRFDLEKEEKRQ